MYVTDEYGSYTTWSITLEFSQASSVNLKQILHCDAPKFFFPFSLLLSLLQYVKGGVENKMLSRTTCELH